MYQNSFWDTVKGQQLADNLIEYLPTVAKNATVQKRTKQYTALVTSFDIEKINKELQAGAKIVHVVPCSGCSNRLSHLFIVFEKEI